MKGEYDIVVQNKRVQFKLRVRRNITLIRGNSATGKTTLVDMVREYSINGASSGIQLICEKRCEVLEGKNWLDELKNITNSIVFIDEGNKFVESIAFAREIKGTDNYYIIISREKLEMIPYSIKEIYGIQESGKYSNTNNVYTNEIYGLYERYEKAISIKPDIVVTEDSNSGFQFFKHICSKNNKECIAASGKTNIVNELNKLDRSKNVVAIVDGAAFGSNMSDTIEFIKHNSNCTLYTPESFEWVILKSDILKDSEIVEILTNPSNFIDSKSYHSWERFFTKLLINKTLDGKFKYNKHKLSKIYTHPKIESKILDTMKIIDFSTKIDT